MSQFQHSVRQTFRINQFSVATVTFATVHVTASFFEVLEGPHHTEKQKWNFFRDIVTTIKIKKPSTLEKRTHRYNQRVREKIFRMSQADCQNNNCAATLFLKRQRNQINDLQDFLERYCIALPVFVFNSAKQFLNLINSFLLLILDKKTRYWTCRRQKKRTSSSRSIPLKIS